MSCPSTTTAASDGTSLPCVANTQTTICQSPSGQSTSESTLTSTSPLPVTVTSCIDNTSISAITNVCTTLRGSNSLTSTTSNATPVLSIPGTLFTTTSTLSTNSDSVNAVSSNTIVVSETKTANNIPETNSASFVSSPCLSTFNTISVAGQCLESVACQSKANPIPSSSLATSFVLITTSQATINTISTSTPSPILSSASAFVCDQYTKGLENNTSEPPTISSMATSQPTRQSTCIDLPANNFSSIQSKNSKTATSMPSVTSCVGKPITTFSGSNLIPVSSVPTAPVATSSEHKTCQPSTFTTKVTAATQTTMTTQVDITQEETNFLRLSSLVLKIGSRAVRRLFDMLNYPATLNQKIKDNRKELKDLLHKRIITKDQWEILFPGNKHSSSKKFDITLMIAFLRKISGVKNPKSGWNTKPDSKDCETEDDLARIQYYRNMVAHSTSCTIDSFSFESMWNDLSKAIIRLGGEGLETETTALLSSALDASYNDLYVELKTIRNKIIPQNIQPFMEVKIEEMVKDDKTFVHTKATKFVKESLNQSNIIMVTGPPGCGKTSTVNHIALQLQEDGYKICPILSTKDIIDYWLEDLHQVFIFNDPFGIHDINQSEVQQWIIYQDLLNIYIKDNRTKILATTRSHIIKDKKISQALPASNLLIVSLIKEDIALTNKERLDIFRTHAKIQERNDLMKMGEEIENLTIPCFPLLCKIYTSDKESKFTEKDFFSKPFFLIGKHLGEFRTNDPIRYFCLLYCMVNGNNLNKSLLCVGEEKKDVKTNRKLLLEKCELPKSLSRETISSKMDTLLDTYLKKEGDRYMFIHDIIYDAFIRHVNSLSSDFKKLVLQTCTSKFLNERIRLNCILTSHTEDAFLNLNSELESDWGARILKDILNGHWNDLVNNTALHHERGDKLLAQSLKNVKQSDFGKCYSRETVSSTLDKIQKDSRSYIDLHLHQVTIVHLIVCLGLKHCLTDILKSRTGLRLLNLPLNLLLVACITGKTNIAEILLANQWNADNSDIGITDISLVYISSFYGHDEIVELLIADNADVNKCNKNEQSPLCISSERGNYKVVEVLLRHEAEINQCDGKGRSPLYVSSAEGHDKVVELLLTYKADINKCDEKCKSPLYASSENGHEKIVNLLLIHDADIDKCDECGQSPLYISSARGNVEVVKILLNHKAKINKCDDNYKSPLYIASKFGYDKVVELLLSREAEINTCDKTGKSPLFISSENGHHKIVQILLSNKAEKNKSDKYCKSPLYISSENGHVKVVKLLLKHKADINFCDECGKSPLYISSSKGYDEVVKILLNNEADINGCDEYGQSPLYISSARGFDKVVTLLLSKKADIDRYDNYGQSPLYISSAFGYNKVVKLLLSYKADLNKCDDYGKSPLFISSENGHDQVVRLLLSHKADIDLCDKYGKSPLYTSSENGHAEVVKLLLSHEAEKNNCDDYGKSPLFISSENGHYEVVELLLSHEADINKCNKEGQSPLHISSEKGHHKVVKLLLSQKVNVNKCDKHGKSPLYVSSAKGHDKVVKILLNHEADINKCDNHGKSSLHTSSENGHVEVVKLLLSHKADINICDECGKSALYTASAYGHVDVVNLLLKKEADVNICDKDGKSPLSISSENAHEEVVEILRSHGADKDRCDKNRQSSTNSSKDKYKNKSDVDGLPNLYYFPD